MKLKIEQLGYSEDGMMRAVLKDLLSGSQASKRFPEFLKLIKFPNGTNEFHRSLSKILEFPGQSFSDFGESDTVIYLEAKSWLSSLFLEVKVNRSQGKPYSLQEELAKFRYAVDQHSHVSFSNLFNQLHSKRVVVEKIRSVAPGEEATISHDAIPSLLKRSRSIGKNPVVLKGVKLLRPYCENPFYVALVPSSPAEASQVFGQELRNWQPKLPYHQDFTRWGYLCWSEVHAFCLRHRMEAALRVFEFNKGQIY